MTAGQMPHLIGDGEARDFLAGHGLSATRGRGRGWARGRPRFPCRGTRVGRVPRQVPSGRRNLLALSRLVWARGLFGEYGVGVPRSENSPVRSSNCCHGSMIWWRDWPRTAATPANRGRRTRRSDAGATLPPPAQSKKPGGQKGHPGATRELIDEPDYTVVLPLTGPCACGRCRLEPIKQVAKTLKDRWQGIPQCLRLKAHQWLRRGP